MGLFGRCFSRLNPLHIHCCLLCYSAGKSCPLGKFLNQEGGTAAGYPLVVLTSKTRWTEEILRKSIQPEYQPPQYCGDTRWYKISSLPFPRRIKFRFGVEFFRCSLPHLAKIQAASDCVDCPAGTIGKQPGLSQCEVGYDNPSFHFMSHSILDCLGQSNDISFTDPISIYIYV